MIALRALQNHHMESMTEAISIGTIILVIIVFVVVFFGIQLYRRWNAGQMGVAGPNSLPNAGIGGAFAQRPPEQNPNLFYS
jgi:predicted transporter